MVQILLPKSSIPTTLLRLIIVTVIAWLFKSKVRLPHVTDRYFQKKYSYYRHIPEKNKFQMKTISSGLSPEVYDGSSLLF